MEVLRAPDGKVLGTLALVGFLGLVFRLYNALILKPRKLRQLLKKQGIDGPPQTVLLGNITKIRNARSSTGPGAAGERPVHHDCTGAFFPLFEQWRKQFGDMFVFGLGNIQTLFVNQPDVIREIITCTSPDLGKPSYQHKELWPLLGQGILTSNGTIWAHQRKILAPQLYIDKVKGMLSLMNESALTLVNSWQILVDGAGGVAEINIDEQTVSFSGDVISRACFGSNYENGKHIFHKLRALQEAISKKTMSSEIPGMRYLPTKNNREVWALGKEVHTLILEVVKERMQVAASEKDLLQMVLEGAKNSDLSQEATDRFIVDNCKNIYFAGFETTAVSATWCLMLLAANPDWQDRLRAEAFDICSGHIPDWDMLRKMKQLTMVIHESLRLYSPAPVISREAFKDMEFGDLKVPEGVILWIFALALHINPEIWGPDSYNFNPERFANGITGACKFPHLYMPFGIGPRVCIGQNFAIIELKILISLILCNFSVALSPKYIHSPIQKLVIKPEFGVDLLVKRL